MRLIKIRKVDIFILFISICAFILGIIIGLEGGCEIKDISITSINSRDIFVNNLKVALAILFIGTISGGIYGIFVLALNGYLVGELIQFLAKSDNLNLIITGIFPHIFVELVGLICFEIVGMYPIYLIICWLREREKLCAKKVAFKLIKILALGILLLMISAIIECNISTIY